LLMGMNDYISKPFKLNDLYLKIAKILNVELEANQLFKHKTSIKIGSFKKIIQDDELKTEESEKPSNFKLENCLKIIKKEPLKKIQIQPKFIQIQKFKLSPSKIISNNIKHLNRNTQVKDCYLELFSPKEKIKLANLINQSSHLKSSKSKNLESSFNKFDSKRDNSLFIHPSYPSSKFKPSPIKKVSGIRKLIYNEKINYNKDNAYSQGKNTEPILPIIDTYLPKIENSLTIKAEVEIDKFKIEVISKLSGGDKDFENEIINEFLKETTNQMAKLNEFIDIKDFEGIKFLSHKMKSSVDMFGLSIVKKKLIEINTNSKIKNISPILLLYDEVQFAFKTIFQDLEKILTTYK